MSKLQPCDQFLLKIANSALEGRAYEPLEALDQENLTTHDESKVQTSPDDGTIRDGDSLVSNMNKLVDDAVKARNEQKLRHKNSPRKSDSFYLDEDVLHMGAPFTLSPPYLSP